MGSRSTHGKKCCDCGCSLPKAIQWRRGRRDPERPYSRSQECILGNDVRRGRGKGLEEKRGSGETLCRVRGDKGQRGHRSLPDREGSKPRLFHPEIRSRISPCPSLPGILVRVVCGYAPP